MKVRVNPNYHGNGWYDPRSGMNFFKRDGVITIPEEVDKSNINRHINLNYLIEIIEEQPEPQQELVVQTPGQLLAEDNQRSAVEAQPEEIVEEEQTEVKVKSETVEDNPLGDIVEETIESEEEKHICQFCSRELKTAGGKATHEKSCKENPDNK